MRFAFIIALGLTLTGCELLQYVVTGGRGDPPQSQPQKKR